MVDFQNLFNPVLIILIIIAAGFSFFYYRLTITPLPKGIKITLTLLRSITLIIMLLAIFNSAFGLISQSVETKKNLIFIDNSNSIAATDSTARIKKIEDLISSLKGKGNIFFTFGSKVEELGNRQIALNEPYTNFGAIADYAAAEGSEPASVTIVSDGIITEGVNPVYALEKLAVPVFTVAIGDSSLHNDIMIEEPRFNEPVYKNRTAVITASIINSGLGNKNVSVRLSEGNKLIEQKAITLSGNGIDNVSFNYTPASYGYKRLNISIPPLGEETNKGNNSKSFPRNVLNDKEKVLLLSGSPSPDMQVLSGMFSADERIRLETITEMPGGKNIKGGNAGFPADSSDIFILLNYPSAISTSPLLSIVKEQITVRKKPFLIILGSGTDLNRLKEFETALPFTVSSSSNEELSIEVYAGDTGNFLINPSDEALWELLPPVIKTGSLINAKPGCSTILKAKIRNTATSIPVVFTRIENGQKSGAIIASNIWKWKVQPEKRADFLADRLFSNLFQWFASPVEKKNFILKSAKKVYSLGERIEISGSLHDDLLNPVENAQVSLSVKGEGKYYTIPMTGTGNGFYTAEIENAGAGNLHIEGTVKLNNRSLSDTLRLYIENVKIERIDTRMNVNLLKQAGSLNGGVFYSIDNYAGLKEKLDSEVQNINLKRKKYFDFRFASNEFILIILITLFVLEWAIRKIYRLL